MDEVLALLKSEYGICSDLCRPAAGGFSAKASYRVRDFSGAEFFVKVYDKALPTTRFFVDRIDAYMPVLDRLSACPALSGRILEPVSTRNGAYKAETESDVYALFLYVQGNVPGIRGMTRSQTAELAETLALLHEAGEDILFETRELDEDVSLPFCERLICFLDDISSACGALHEAVHPYAGLLRSAARKTLNLRDTLRLGHSPLVLCHGDAHGNNVIQGERLVLADWEDLRRAPAEADLFIYAWHPHGDTLLSAYSAARRGFEINRNLLFFYVLRRRVEDVWVDIQRLTEESPDEAEKAKLMNYVRQGIAEVQKLFNG